MQRHTWNNQTTTGSAMEPPAFCKHGNLTTLNVDQRNPLPWLQGNGKRRPGVGDNMDLAHLLMKQREFSLNGRIQSIQTGKRQGSLTDDSRESAIRKTAKVLAKEGFNAGEWAVSICAEGPSGCAHCLELNCLSEPSSR